MHVIFAKNIILILFGLRFISSVFLIFLLLNIFVKQLKNQTEKPIILFAIDNSSSIVSNQDSVYIKSVLQEKIGQLKEKIQVKIRAKQELINLETDQNKKNELIHDLQILQMRNNMADTKEKIQNMK